MIRGYFSGDEGRKRPFFSGRFTFNSYERLGLETKLLVDTGADRTVLSPNDARALSRSGVDLRRLPHGPASAGIGGRVQTRMIEAALTLGSTTVPVTLTVIEPSSELIEATRIPSLLGRDVISQFALFMDERTERVFLLEAAEADALHFDRLSP